MREELREGNHVAFILQVFFDTTHGMLKQSPLALDYASMLSGTVGRGPSVGGAVGVHRPAGALLDVDGGGNPRPTRSSTNRTMGAQPSDAKCAPPFRLGVWPRYRCLRSRPHPVEASKIGVADNINVSSLSSFRRPGW